MYTREEYENLINNSPLFEVDKETSSTLYETERRKLLKHISEYYDKYVFPNKDIDQYGLELMIAADDSIKYFKPGEGVFLHYLNSVLHQKRVINEMEEMLKFQRGGVKVSVIDERLLRQIKAFAKSKELDVTKASVREEIAKALSIPLSRIDEVFSMEKSVTVLSNFTVNEDGEEINVLENTASPLLTAEEVLANKSASNTLYDVIEEVFNGLQDRSKEKIGYCLTAELLAQLNYDVALLKERIENRSFYMDLIVLYYVKFKKVPTQRQIAERTNVKENSLSRTYNEFKEKVLKVIKEKRI